MDLLVIWHLLNVGEDEDQWVFSTNYKLQIDDRRLAQRLQAEVRREWSSETLDPLRDGVRLLVSEVAAQTSGEEEESDGGFSLRLRRNLDRLMRKPTADGWVDRVAAIGDRVEPSGDVYGDFSVQLLLDELSTLGRRTVARLDQFATDLCYDALRETAASLEGAPPDVTQPDRRRRVFISYRRSHTKVASWLFERLNVIGQGQLFRPYLDLSELAPGPWRPQLEDEIRNSDLFIPVVSPNYGEQGSVSAEELALATALSDDAQLKIVPVFVPEGRDVEDLLLSELDGHPVRDTADLPGEEEALAAWLGRIGSA